MKQCNYCLTEKPDTEFYKKSTAKDGLFWWCRACHKEKMKAKYHEKAAGADYREKENTRVKDFYAANPAAKKTYGRAYAEKHRAKINAYLKNRYSKKLHRTPAWLTVDDLWLIEQTYDLAQKRTEMLGFAWQVDHIIPLQGRVVSGLHVPHNLQVIPACENRKKSNRFNVT
jgi:hypothetical protein